MDEKELRSAVEGMSAGRVRQPRFTKQEVQASNGREHDTLWATILSLEPAGTNFRKGDTVSRSEIGAPSQNGNPSGIVERLVTRYESDPRTVIGTDADFDAATGEVRFIDPRVWLNDPGAGFVVLRFGRRTPHGFVRAPSYDPYSDYDGDEEG